jgi:hypothetical protein
MAGQKGSAGAKRNKNKQMAATLKARGEERMTGKCCICGGIVSLDRPEKGSQGAMESHMAKHARGAI